MVPAPGRSSINLTVPHLARPIAIVVMIQSIFHLSLYAEIEIVSRGNGNKNLPYLIGEFTSNNIGAASATGIFAVILANIIAIFLLRMVGKSLMELGHRLWQQLHKPLP